MNFKHVKFAFEKNDLDFKFLIQINSNGLVNSKFMYFNPPTWIFWIKPSFLEFLTIEVY